MLYKKNVINIFLTLIPLIIFIYAFFSELYPLKFFTILLLVPYLFTLYILYENRNGLTFVYLIYLLLSSVSIPIIELLINDPLKNLTVNTSWYNLDVADKSILIAYIFILTFCFLANIYTIFVNKNDTSKIFSISNYNKKYHMLGCALVLLFTVFLVYQFVSGNLSIFSTYQDYFLSTSSIPFYATSLFIYSVGIICILSSMSLQKILPSILLILLPGALLLITGNRGELLYPAMAGLGILIIRGVKLNKKILFILALVFFLIIPFLGETRNIENFEEIKDVQISPLSPFLTIGYTLRPLVYTTQWIENGETHLNGESFAVPIQRGFANNIPGLEAIQYEGKTYNYRERLPTMGYSIIAESYHNFGVLGSFLISSVILTFFLFGERTTSINRLVLAGGITAILINNIRNAFAFVPGQVVMLLTILILYNLVWRVVINDKEINSSSYNK